MTELKINPEIQQGPQYQSRQIRWIKLFLPAERFNVYAAVKEYIMIRKYSTMPKNFTVTSKLFLQSPFSHSSAAMVNKHLVHACNTEA